MKFTITVLFFCICLMYMGCNTSTGPGSEPQLSFVSNIPDSKKISFIDENCGFAVCSNSKIYKTVDGGKKWIALDIPTSEKIQDIQFIDRNNGWFMTYNSIFKTNDAGKSWELILRNEENYSFIAMNLVSNNLGFVSGTKDAKIYRTNNGGKNWELVDLKAVGKINFIHFIDENSGWASEAVGKIYHTNDKGNTWKSTSSVRFATCIYAINSKTCYAGNTMSASSLANAKASVYRTDDSGENWKDLAFPESMIINKIIFQSMTHGCALSDIGDFSKNNNNTITGSLKLIYTEDSGKSWKSINTDGTSIKDICLAGKKLMVLLWNDNLFELKD